MAEKTPVTADTVRPYYDDGVVTIYHGDCAEILPQVAGDLLVTDPPYPNNAGWFDDAIGLARAVVADARWREAVVFWSDGADQGTARTVTAHIDGSTASSGPTSASSEQFDGGGS